MTRFDHELQAGVAISFYELDAPGLFVYRRGAIEMPKGCGKSPLGAVLCLAEFAGPVAPPGGCSWPRVRRSAAALVSPPGPSAPTSRLTLSTLGRTAH